ncbi:MAG: hypothetical protein EOR76_36035 [Mesorhizobium sp.]|nr:MAG: hypothetical protein EOR76_36035 [Mesorhizobium sp.]
MGADKRRAQIGLNKGEAHHALKRAISFHRRGEIRDRVRQSGRLPGSTANIICRHSRRSTYPIPKQGANDD